jgi:hypothetical protein
MLWLVTNINEERFQGMSAEDLGAKVNDMLDCSCVQDARVCLHGLVRL